jgi:hypothetical protein
MKENHKDRKVGLVTFTDYVEIIGDGSKKSLRLNGSDLNDYNIILKNSVAGAGSQMKKPISKTHDSLKD